jgi:hypothetical protein
VLAAHGRNLGERLLGSVAVAGSMLPYSVGTAITGGALLAGIGASASQLGTSVAAVACADGDCGNEASPIIMQGRTILTNPAEAVSQGLKKVAAEPGIYDIATHGTKTSAKVWRNGKYITMNADEFVEHILSSTGYLRRAYSFALLQLSMWSRRAGRQ